MTCNDTVLPLVCVHHHHFSSLFIFPTTRHNTSSNLKEDMGNTIHHCRELSSESLLIDISEFPDCDFDVFIINEPNLLKNIGQFVTMPLDFYDTIIKWSSKNISTWMSSTRIGPSSVSRDEFVIIRLSLSWILQRNTLDWYKKQVYNELTKLHPGVFPVYDTPVWNDNDNRSRCPKGMDQEILIRGEKNMDITLVKVRMSHYFYDTLFGMVETRNRNVHSTKLARFQMGS